MAEELGQGGVSWWNSPRSLLSSSPCSNSFGWLPTHHLITETKSDESAASTTLIPANPDAWNQDLLRDRGTSEENNYCSFLLDSSMNYRPSSVEQTQSQSLSSSADQSYSLLQTLFDTDSQPHQSLLDHQKPISYSHHSAANYHMNSNGFLPKSSPTANASLSPTFPPSPPSHLLANPIHSIAAKQHEQRPVVKKANNEPTFKRPRIETPSPLPTFKVRKEKLGDRITALQQLVSPFGKTDTASVLHEAIEYIKFLHDQVNALSTPYLKYGSPPVQGGERSEDEGKDLKTRGLCLVPISSTFPVAAETTSDFWTPTFGGSFR